MRAIRKKLFLAGFTLIELLVVVAIIAILAAIAVPNLIEAQTRSKVSRAKADMRSIATALEAYQTDHNRYPPNSDLRYGFNVTPREMSTPIAYLSIRPIDPFKLGKGLGRLNPNVADEEIFYDYYEILTANEFIKQAMEGRNLFILCVDASGPLANAVNRGALYKYGPWLQWSVGPDSEFWIAGDDFASPISPANGLKAPAHPPWGYSFDVPYDPTNGTVSFGNIIRTYKQPEGTVPFQIPAGL